MKLTNLAAQLFKTKAAVAPMGVGNSGQLVPVPSSSSMFGFIRESFTGAWQRNIVVDNDRNLLAFSAVYACITLIANDIGKMRLLLLEETKDGIWQEVTANSPFLPVLTKPNPFQNRIQFLIHWITSKLLHGNTYVLKQRDGRGIVTGLFILDPRLVTPLVTDDGSVYYQLGVDTLSEIKNSMQAVPASEIIHDRMPTLWHPLVGVSPIYACGSSATQGIRIQANSAAFFENMSRPSGVLTAPGHIPPELAERLKAAFEENFSGSKLGRLAVLGDALHYEAMTIPAADAQLIEQLKWTVEDVARCFHVPLHLIGSGPNPTFQNIGAFNQSYYTQTLQSLIESLELCLSEGLSLPARYTAELDLEALLRMDTSARYEALGKALASSWMSPNEARLRENMPPVTGGSTIYMQQQNYAIAALAKRDAKADPFAPPTPPTPPAPPTPPPAAGPVPPAPPPEQRSGGGGGGDGDDDGDVVEFAVKLISAFSEAPYAES